MGGGSQAPPPSLRVICSLLLLRPAATLLIVVNVSRCLDGSLPQRIRVSMVGYLVTPILERLIIPVSLCLRASVYIGLMYLPNGGSVEPTAIKPSTHIARGMCRAGCALACIVSQKPLRTGLNNSTVSLSRPQWEDTAPPHANTHPHALTKAGFCTRKEVLAHGRGRVWPATLHSDCSVRLK